MRYLRFFSLLLAAALMITFASCSDSREGEEPLDENTSQINLILVSEGDEPFVTSEGYLINLTHGELDLDEVVISGHEEDHDHHHIISSKVKHDHHHDDEEGGICIFEGPFEVNLLRQTDLGFQFTNPGNYSLLSLIIGEHHHDHAHHLKNSRKKEYISYLQKDHDDEHEDDDHHDDDHCHHASVELKGSAVKEGIEYLFKVHLHMEEEIDLTDLGLELRRGHHRRVGLIFEVDHWLDHVDISQAPVVDGTHIISDELTPETALIIMDNIRRNIKTHLFD